MTTITTTNPPTRQGAWIAYYPDWSGWTLYESEIEALRAAVANKQQVMFCPWKRDPREELAQQEKREAAAKVEAERLGLAIGSFFREESA